MLSLNEMQCIAIRHKKAGPCKLHPIEDGLCKMHLNSKKLKGPKEWQREQAMMHFNNQKIILKERMDKGEDLQEELAILQVRFNISYSRLHKKLEETVDTVEDVERARVLELRRFRRERQHEIRLVQRRQQRIQEQQLHRLRDMENVEQEGGIAEIPDFVDDEQNVHRTVTVQMVKKTIERVILISVPDEYKWNTRTISKTPGEIIAECNLSIQAGKLLMEKYTSYDTIYGMEVGIYGKTIDSVWQYIKNSSDRSVLYKTLKTELEDNVGACSEGNLTRLCNVLNGYIDDMPAPPISEILGDLLPPLLEIENLTERREKAIQIMRTHNVSDEELDTWLEPLMQL